MGILVFLVFVFGVYTFIARLRRKELPEETRQLGARLGRSAHGAIPLPGLMGQAPADFMPAEPWRESVGPSDEHTLVLDASGRPVTNEEPAEPNDLGPYRDPKVALMPTSAPRPKRKKKKRPTPEA
jgi:hypothetical protein